MRKFLALLFLTIPASIYASPGDIHYVGKLQAEIKSEPSAISETKFIIALGRKVVEFETRGDWVWVGVDRTGGKDGWILKSKLSETDPDGLKY